MRVFCFFLKDNFDQSRVTTTNAPFAVRFKRSLGGSKMSINHGIRTLGVLGAGQMGTGIALVSALRARVPVLLYDRSTEQVTKGLALMDKLLAKDVAKGRLSSEEAKEARDKVSVVGPEAGIKGMREVDMVIEVTFLYLISRTASKMNISNQAVSESLPLKQSIFASFAAELKPEAILATNTSSISITKIAASAMPAGVNSASQEGKMSAGRVVGATYVHPGDQLCFNACN